MSDQWSAAPFQRIASYYDDLVGRHGHDPKACDYGRRESQRIKFQVLAKVMDLRDKRILNVGCGFADYARYLAETVGPVTYTGIDLSSRMIQEGKRLSPHLDLRVANLLATDVTSWDVVTANGIFYLLGEEARNLMPQLIRAMFERAGMAVAFNSLSSWAARQEPGEFYADPLETVTFCRTLSPWVVLRHNYFPHDFTVYLYRKQLA